MMSREGSERTAVGRAAEALLYKLAERAKMSEAETQKALYTVRSLVVGATLMLEDGTLPNTPATFSMIRSALSEAF